MKVYFDWKKIHEQLPQKGDQVIVRYWSRTFKQYKWFKGKFDHCEEIQYVTAGTKTKYFFDGHNFNPKTLTTSNFKVFTYEVANYDRPLYWDYYDHYWQVPDEDVYVRTIEQL